MSGKRRRFTREFKEEVVRLADREVKSIREVAEDLGIHETVLKRWRCELAAVKLERDLPKNAAAYFAQHMK